jgi:ASC-1-like (ASCH) protein
MATIKKKLWKEYWDLLESGKKKYELRLNDFEVHEGDILLLQEWDKDKQEYTGRELERKVTYKGVLALDGSNFVWSKEELLEKGIVIMSLE